MDLKQINIDIAKRIKETRRSVGMSQMELGKRIGVSYQQVQKYENGISYASVKRLGQIATALGIPASDLIGINASQTGTVFPGLDTYEVRVVKLFRKIKDGDLRQGIIRIIERLVKLQ